MSQPPPAPFQILRTHSAPLSCLAFNPTNTLLYAGDQDGWISVTDLKIRRAVLFWKAHEGGVTTVEEWDGRLIRDNLIHIYERLPLIRRPTARTPNAASHRGDRGSKGRPGRNGQDGPVIWKSLTVNSLNFCRFSLLPIPPMRRHSQDAGTFSTDGQSLEANMDPSSTPTEVNGMNSGAEALLAVPNLVDSELADVYHLPSMTRLHAALNTPNMDASQGKGKGKGKAKAVPDEEISGTDATKGLRAGLIMSMHLRFLPASDAAFAGSSASHDRRRLALILGYEDGRIDVWTSTGTPNPFLAEQWRQFSDGSGRVRKKLWELTYSGKGHNEAVSIDGMTAYTVSADHLLVKYDIKQALLHPLSSAILTTTSLKQIGNATLAISSNDRVLAVGGWDGKIRLLSATSLKPLGTLSYHRETIQCLVFAQSSKTPEHLEIHSSEPDTTNGGDQAHDLEEIHAEASTIEIGDEDYSDSEDDLGGNEGVPAERWLASGGKDKRIGLWGLMDFSSR